MMKESIEKEWDSLIERGEMTLKKIKPVFGDSSLLQAIKVFNTRSKNAKSKGNIWHLERAVKHLEKFLDNKK